ncbi:MAG: hypothetical protein M0Z52_12170 [Actinomycetota bacterium]|nr:hypothetical protein [Nitrospiraceae bacterium]MDA8157185.1 hypothetical protein [Actinomycetota bacterium]
MGKWGLHLGNIIKNRRPGKKAVWIFSGGFILLAFVLYPVLFMSTTACVPQQQTNYQPLPQYGDLYSFPKYNVTPVAQPDTAHLTVIVAVPRFKDTATQEYSGAPKISSGGSMTPEMVRIFKSFSGSLSEDIQTQLVAKGMTTKGPFDWDEVTYPDQKASDLTESEEIVLDVHSDTPVFQKNEYYQGGIYAAVYSATLTVGMKVYFDLYEPLSGEKMWIRKIDLGEEDYPYTFALQQVQYISGYSSDGCGGSIPQYSWKNAGELYDGRAKVFSGVLKEAYPKLMKAAWTYFNVEEMQNLKLKTKEIRKKKVYGETPYH